MLEMMMTGGASNPPQFLYVQGSPYADGSNGQLRKYEIKDGQLVSTTPIYSSLQFGIRIHLAINIHGESVFGEGDYLYRLDANGVSSSYYFSGKEPNFVALTDSGIVFYVSNDGLFKVDANNNITEFINSGGYHRRITIDEETQKVYANTRYRGVVCHDFQGTLLWSAGDTNATMTTTNLFLSSDGSMLYVSDTNADLLKINTSAGVVQETVTNGVRDLSGDSMVICSIYKDVYLFMWSRKEQVLYLFDLSNNNKYKTVTAHETDADFIIAGVIVPDRNTGGFFCYAQRTATSFAETEHKFVVFNPLVSTTSFSEIPFLSFDEPVGSGLE